MIDPVITPKHDFTPATSRTAYHNADALAQQNYGLVLAMSRNIVTAKQFYNEAFKCAVDGAGLLQNFMNYTRHKIEKDQGK